jgi:hypothetical protein
LMMGIRRVERPDDHPSVEDDRGHAVRSTSGAGRERSHSSRRASRWRGPYPCKASDVLHPWGLPSRSDGCLAPLGHNLQLVTGANAHLAHNAHRNGDLVLAAEGVHQPLVDDEQ